MHHTLPAALLSPPQYSLSDSPIGRPRRLRFVPVIDATRSLHFSPMVREIRENGPPLRIGRLTHRDAILQNDNNEENQGTPSADREAGYNALDSARQLRLNSHHNSRLHFNSKVVSRMHAEIWCEGDGQMYIRDTKSSSGTFLNHHRLAPPNKMSIAFPLHDGDVIQFGVDYQGGIENAFRAVRARVEIDRRPRQVTEYGAAATELLRRITDLESAPLERSISAPAASNSAVIAECCICLINISVNHAIFSAPCSHMFHYKCIRPLLNLHFPAFQCPLCRSFADLEADDEEEVILQTEMDVGSDGSSSVHQTSSTVNNTQ